MHHLRSFQLRDMTACGAALRRLGADATSLEQVADRLVRHLYRSLTMGQHREPACNLVRLFKTIPYSRLTPDLRALADTRLGNTPPPPSLTCLTLQASAGTFPGWNDATLSSRFRVIPLDTPEAIDQLPMFSQLFRQLGISLPSLTQPAPNILLDQHKQSFNVFHIPEAKGSPYVPEQEEFVRKYGIRSVLGFGAPLPDGELFSIILFSKDFIPESTAQLFKPLALCAQIALAPYATTLAAFHPHRTSMPEQAGDNPTSVHDAHLQARIADLERLLAVHEQTVDEQADRMELIVPSSQMGTWDWEIPTGRVTFNERWASMLGYGLDELEPHVRTWEHLVHPDDLHRVRATVSAHLHGDTPTYSSEHRLRTKSGAWCWVFDSGRVVKRDATGAPLRAAGIHLDISDRKALETAQARAQCDLQAKQQALDEAQTLAHLGSWHWNIATGQEAWSEEQCRIFGLDPIRNSPTYATFLAALHPDDSDRVKQTMEAATDANAPPLITRHTLSESQAGPKPRLLLAEDNPVNQKVACKMLEKLGYRVDVAGNGQEAVAAHERSPYPLIFMDCQMPEVDGFEATRLIRQREQRQPSTVNRQVNDTGYDTNAGRCDSSRVTNDESRMTALHRVPIIAMTANAMQGDRERCLAAGMDDYVAKPIRPKDLQAILDTWLRKHNQAAAS